jgi:four helix bundle protein
MSNIAEGFARKTSRDFAHFLDVARGSAVEVQSLLYVSVDVGHISADDFKALHELAGEVVSLVSGFTTYLRRLHIERQ